jgi:hypothetical protein
MEKKFPNPPTPPLLKGGKGGFGNFFLRACLPVGRGGQIGHGQFIWDLEIEIWILSVTLSYGHGARTRSRYELGSLRERHRGCGYSS